MTIRRFRLAVLALLAGLLGLEHIDDLDEILEGFLSMSNANTILVISGPTENVFYRAGSRLAGFSGHYHKRNIYDIEETLKAKDLKCRTVRTLYHPVPLFRVSSWKGRQSSCRAVTDEVRES